MAFTGYVLDCFLHRSSDFLETALLPDNCSRPRNSWAYNPA